MSNFQLRGQAAVLLHGNAAALPSGLGDPRGTFDSNSDGGDIFLEPTKPIATQGVITFRRTATGTTTIVAPVILEAWLSASWDGYRSPKTGEPVNRDGTAINDFEWTQVGLFLDDEGNSNIPVPSQWIIDLGAKWVRLRVSGDPDDPVDVFYEPRLTGDDL